MELYELKPTREQSSTLHDRGITGNSGASLHAKTFSIDGKTVFIGSFNFDPRSTLLNTEMGFVIESETLAQLIDKRFIQSQYDAARQLRLTGGDGSTGLIVMQRKRLFSKRTRHQFLEAGYGQTGVDIARGMVIVNAA